MSTHGLTLGQKIRGLRRQMGMTQADLAGDDFTKSFISQIEKDQARPSLKSLRIFAQRLNRPVSYFLDDEPGESTVPVEAMRSLSTGDLLERQGKYEEALRLYEKALKQCPPTDYGCRGQAYQQRARVLNALDQPQAALQALTLASEEFRLAKDASARATVDRALGQVYTRLRMAEKAIHHYERALLLFEEVLAPRADAESAFSLIHLLTELGLLAAETGDSDGALRYLQRAEALSQEFDLFYRWGDASLAMSSLHAEQDDMEQAVHYARRAVACFETSLQHDGLVEALVQLGTVRFKEGGKRAAEQYFDQALELAERASDSEGVSRVREAMASLARDEGDFERAVALYKEASVGAKEDGRTLSIHRSLAELFRSRQQWDEAAEHLETVAQHLERSNSSRALMETYSALAEVYEAGGHSDDAARCLQRTMEIYRKQ